jgi:hypothetical protein
LPSQTVEHRVYGETDVIRGAFGAAESVLK